MKKFIPVAMKCNQEQFDAIRPKLKDNGLNINVWGGFCTYNYLCNYYDKNIHMIGNLECYDANNNGRKLYHEWNEEIFLNACGIETVRKYELTVEQIRKLASNNSWCEKFLKNLYPDAFETETEVTQKELIEFYKKEKGIDNLKVVI